MKKTFSLMKALKVGLASLALAGTCLMGSTASAQQYVSTRGTQIVDPSGNPLFFNGTNLGNWLVWEGYMMMDDSNYRTHGQFFAGLQKAVDGDLSKAVAFERVWRENYVTQKTIDELQSRGYNSIRVPFNYRLIWDIYNNKPNADAFTHLDRLVSYCRGKGIYLLLDMHGAPGFQNPGDHSDNNLSNKDHPQWTVQWLNGTYDGGAVGANVAMTAQIWKYIADHYKNEPVIWGYDIVNEPQTNISDTLWYAYKKIIEQIRQADGNHIVVVEGDNWGGYMDMFTNYSRPPLDPKVVLETHHYVFSDWNSDAWNNISQLYGRATIAKNLNVPIILGEFGEEQDPYLAEIRRVAIDAQYRGVFSWSFKKVSKDRTLWSIKPDSNTREGRAFIALRNAINWGTTLSAASGGQSTYTDLINFATYAVRNGDPKLVWGQSFYDNTSAKISSAPTPSGISGISGTYAIISKSSANAGYPIALEVRGGWNYNGAPIQQWGWEGLAWQKWNIIPLGGDVYKIINVYTNKALDLKGGNTWDGGGIQTWDDAGVANQQWKIQRNSAGNAYTIKSVVKNASQSEIAIDVPGGTNLNGKDLQVWTFYANNVNQEWELRKQ